MTVSRCRRLSSWDPQLTNVRPPVCLSTLIYFNSTDMISKGAFFAITEQGNYGNGTNNNTFNYVDPDGNTYWRNVGASDNNITYDSIGGSLSAKPFALPFSAPLQQGPMAKPRLPGGK